MHKTICHFNELTRVIPPSQCCENHSTKRNRESKALLKGQEKVAMLFGTGKIFFFFCLGSVVLFFVGRKVSKTMKRRTGVKIELFGKRKRNGCEELLVVFKFFRT